MNVVAKLCGPSEGPTFLDYVAHPLANTFPMIEGHAFEDLKADIRKQGILEPIRLYQGMILDGRNRYAAAKAVAYAFSAKDFREWIGTPAEAEAWVISTNFHRRQLTNAQKQEVIQNMIKRYPQMGDREIARELNVSHSTVGAARDRLANSPEVKQYADFLKRWDKLSDDQCREFVKGHANDLRIFLADVEVAPTS